MDPRESCRAMNTQWHPVLAETRGSGPMEVEKEATMTKSRSSMAIPLRTDTVAEQSNQLLVVNDDFIRRFWIKEKLA